MNKFEYRGLDNFDFLYPELKDSDSTMTVMELHLRCVTVKLSSGEVPMGGFNIATDVGPLGTFRRKETTNIDFYPVWKGDEIVNLDLKVGDVIRYRIVKQPKRW